MSAFPGWNSPLLGAMLVSGSVTSVVLPVKLPKPGKLRQYAPVPWPSLASLGWWRRYMTLGPLEDCIVLFYYPSGNGYISHLRKNTIIFKNALGWDMLSLPRSRKYWEDCCSPDCFFLMSNLRKKSRTYTALFVRSSRPSHKNQNSALLPTRCNCFFVRHGIFKGTGGWIQGFGRWFFQDYGEHLPVRDG